MDIVSIIGEFVQLKKAGASYKGLSPFSNEKTASFFVVPAKELWKDFSSGKGGSVVDFVMEKERLSFPEAIKWLAAKVGVSIEDRPAAAQDTEQETMRKAISRALQLAADYFTKCLPHSIAPTKYLTDRGFTDATIREFGIGVHAGGWTSMQDAICSSVDKDTLLKSGLVKEGAKGSYDFFHDRLIFPIHSISGKIITLAGRTLMPDVQPKYINGSETELYHKSKVLYNLHRAKAQIIRDGKCYLVEGYTDVMMMHQHGYTNVIASCGTALTDDQLKLLRRFCDHIVLLYDGDGAGSRATIKAIDLAYVNGFNVSVVSDLEGMDPCEYLLKYGADGFAKLPELDFIDFKAKVYVQYAKGDTVREAAALRSMAQTIACVGDPVTRDLYISRVAQQFNVMPGSIRANVDYFQGVATAPPEVAKVEVAAMDTIEQQLMQALLVYGTEQIPMSSNGGGQYMISAAEYVVYALLEDELLPRGDEFREVFNQVHALLERGEALTVATIDGNSWLRKMRKKVMPFYSPTIVEGLDGQSIKRMCVEIVLQFKNRHLQMEIDRIDAAMGNADEQELESLIREKDKYVTVRQHFYDQYGFRA